MWNLPLPKPSSKPFTEPPEPLPPQHYQNFIGTFPILPHQNLPETSVGSFRKRGWFCWGKTRFWNTEVASKSCGNVSWWTQATGRYTQRREWRKRSRAFVSCGDLKNWKTCWNVPCLAERLGFPTLQFSAILWRLMKVWHEKQHYTHLALTYTTPSPRPEWLQTAHKMKEAEKETEDWYTTTYCK